MSMPDDDVMPKGSAGRVAQRIEVFTGTGRRRGWSAEAKAAIVAESYGGDVSVCDVARRHDLTPSQLFTWRRQLRGPASPPDEPLFVPAMIEGAADVGPVHSEDRARIELEIDGVVVRVGAGSDRDTIAAVIAALKASL